MTPSLPLASITTPEGRAFDATARGTTIVGGLVVNISNTNGSERGRGLEGIGVRFLPTSDPTSDDPPIVTCANATVGVRAGGTVYSDAGGIATCDVRVPDAPGDYYLAIRVGGAIDFTPFTLHVM